jgi:hypothetical protein
MQRAGNDDDRPACSDPVTGLRSANQTSPGRSAA